MEKKIEIEREFDNGSTRYLKKNVELDSACLVPLFSTNWLSELYLKGNYLISKDKVVDVVASIMRPPIN